VRPVVAIARRDLTALLGTATGWLVLAGHLLLAGIFWVVLLDGFVIRSEAFDPYAELHLSLVDHLIGPFFGNVTIVLLVVAPAVTMRSFADEARHRTTELLATSPITPAQIVAGKLLGSLAFVALAILGVAWMPLSLYLWATPDPGALAGGLLALLLLGTAVTAIGTLASSLTDQPLTALVLGFAVVLTLWILGHLDPDPTSLASQLSLSRHVQELVRGAVRASDVAYFLLLTAWATFATWQRVRLWRWA
jgi:ABC-2 type transport system permease protein